MHHSLLNCSLVVRHFNYFPVFCFTKKFAVTYLHQFCVDIVFISLRNESVIGSVIGSVISGSYNPLPLLKEVGNDSFFSYR